MTADWHDETPPLPRETGRSDVRSVGPLGPTGSARGEEAPSDPGATGRPESPLGAPVTMDDLAAADQDAAPPMHDRSVWPAVLAGGLTIVFFGLITTTWRFGILGVLAIILGIGGWVGELTHAHEPES
jgi:hypothetical protein